jgi:hypothetical protein
VDTEWWVEEVKETEAERDRHRGVERQTHTEIER